MRSLTAGQLQQRAEKILVSCLACQRVELWDTLSTGRQNLVLHAQRCAEVELIALGQGRRARALHLSAVIADVLNEPTA